MSRQSIEAKTSRLVDEQMKLVESCRRLVASIAWKFWRKMPPQTRAWINVEDMVEDGIWMAYRTTIGWRKDRGTKFSTYLAGQLAKYYLNEYIDPFVVAKKRCDAKTVSIDDKVKQLKENGFDFDIERALGIATKFHDPLIDCFVVDVFPKLYLEASVFLQPYIYTWFLDSNKQVKVDLRQQRTGFEKAKNEFNELAFTHQLSYGDCLHLLRSSTCLDTVHRRLFEMPYSLDFPTPAVRKEVPAPR